MSELSLVIGPDPIFKLKADPVKIVDDSVRETVDQMFKLLNVANGLGLGANMVGLLDRIAIVDMMENGIRHKLALINPELVWVSTETQEFVEGSLSFPGIEAEIKRPDAIKLKYLNYDGEDSELEAKGWLAQVIQHEIDYLDGVTFLDHLSKLKRDRLLKKYTKQRRSNSN